ncbi:helix-turn-helix domain-containing protein [Halorarum salinum]|uniref:Helix-turn-helix domain-containing protein n=1 Tax=Halorarum salinum TaxID=2743089 RepID=A0A7D5QF46_9EURY|nr:helix-turn-helix domain-containing protein [Halobaculum salinum]QLG60384.1 helix-turn-helix domain-containing protein [Halobaculum salinum]
MDSTDAAAPEDASGERRERWRHAGSPDGDGDGDATSDAGTPVILAEARLSGGPLALSETLRSLPDVSIRPDHHTVSANGDRSLAASISGSSTDRVRSALEADSSVVSFEIVRSFPDHSIYRIDLEESAVLLAPTSLELGARPLSVEGIHDGWRADVQFPDRDSLIALRAFCEEHGISFGVDSLHEADYLDGVTNGLTELQRETLRTAYRLGYFDVPRTTSQAELAAELDVSTSAVSHRLRRATARLVGDELVSSDDGS